ncbi:hypothetical protein BC941DRAFT_422693 [Chlamydoabsidia padenii]|nr:hypothetical protein BC941DRAFT_422693 [Chlamydoabsidia padenii]
MNIVPDQDCFIPGLELISLTDDDYDYSKPDDEDMIDWLDDCELQENLFQILSLTPEETTCDKDNHIIQSDPHHVFEELGYFCDEPEPIDPTMDYEADYQQRMDQQQQIIKKNGRARAYQRQHHMDLASIPVADETSMDADPGLSSTFSSFHHTDDDHSEEDDYRSPLYLGRQSHFNPHPMSKLVLPSHFSFSTARF